MNNNNKTNNFIERAKSVHGNKFDYSNVNYISNKTKVCIICPVHGEFWQRPKDHLHGQGCPGCANKKGGIRGKYTNEEFIDNARKVHGDKYDYSKIEYKNANTPVVIICPEHGEFKMRPSNHLKGQGCSKCSNLLKGSYQKSNTEEFIRKSKLVHGDKYDYNQVDYVNNRVKVIIGCPEHGVFKQKPLDHLHGSGCPECGRKFGIAEKSILNALKEKYITVTYQYKPQWLYNKTSPQSLDMFLPECNIGIEYHGRQHFYPNVKFGGEEQFLKIQERDKRKYQKCLENGIKVFYISFERQVPDDYFAPVYRNVDDLFAAIDNYIEENKINTNESIIHLNENELKRIIKECIREYIIGQKETSD